MAKKILILALCFALVLSGCIYRGNAEGSPTAVVYRENLLKSGGRLIRETVSYGEDTEPLRAVVDALNTDSGSTYTRKAFTSGVKIESALVLEGVAYVEMSKEFLLASELEKLLAESAIVLSLSALDEVCSVDISCAGKIIKSALTAEMIAEADGLGGEYERSVKLYLPEHGRLCPKSVNCIDKGGTGSAELILGELFKALGGGMENAEILDIKTEDGVCSIDLSGEFYGAEPTEANEGKLIVYSIVNSLCRLPDVESVSISVEGYAVASYGGFRCAWPMAANESLISY